jgi:hypothetical protein
MDLKAATGEAGVPFAQASTADPSSPSAAATIPASSGTKVSDNEREGHATRALHAVFMGITFVFIIPLGVVWIRFYGKVRAHYINNAAAFASFLVGLGLAFKISSVYGYGDYKNAHQIIGLIILGLFVVQISLGTAHHVTYKKHQRKTTMGLVHRFLGPLLLLLGLINGIL